MGLGKKTLAGIGGLLAGGIVGSAIAIHAFGSDEKKPLPEDNLEHIKEAPEEERAKMLRLPEGYPSFRDAYCARFPVRENPIPPFKGGWGYSMEDAMLIDNDDPGNLMASISCVDDEKYFITFRLDEEAEYAHKTKFAGATWTKKNHQLVYGNDGKMYDHETVNAQIFTLEDWEFLKQDWESHDGYKNDKEGAERHNQMREERAIRFTEEFWFDVTNCL
ncbi:MAG: hypothetical protein IJS08_11990 [Victivallales bacterium]|nr:hypothetical protein [Victivallales bacterium]